MKFMQKKHVKMPNSRPRKQQHLRMQVKKVLKKMHL
jgi:hypothetical protein